MSSMPFAPETGVLCWRGTFIDVEEPERGMSRGRSRSMPARTSAESSVESDIFSDERAYVDELSEVYSSSAFYFATTRKVETEGSIGKSKATATGARFQVKGVIEPAMKETADSMSTSVSSVEASLPSLVSSSEPSRACSAGSIGHPELCSRPCLYYAMDKCVNGADCEFCHMPHDKQRKTVHLLKRHRLMLERMPTEDAVALIWTELREKVLSFDSSKVIVDALENAAAACIAVPSAPGKSDNRPISTLIDPPSAAEGDGATVVKHALRKVGLRRMILTLQSVVHKPGAESSERNEASAEEALEALLMLLRNTVAQQG